MLAGGIGDPAPVLAAAFRDGEFRLFRSAVVLGPEEQVIQDRVHGVLLHQFHPV